MTVSRAPSELPVAGCSIGVMIATLRRPRDLERCLHALATQVRPPDDVIVVVRDIDAETRQFLETFHDPRCPVRQVIVTAPGLVAARNAGMPACRTDVLAMIDDDTVPYPDWTTRIAAHFDADPRLGGLGGRDRCHNGHGFDDRQSAVVGRIQWIGRLIGNHHQGVGTIRDVDYLKGANMTYRAPALADAPFNTRLRGSGAVPHEDLALSITIRRSGWRLRYDPQVLVDHFAAPRTEPRDYVTIGRISDTASFANHSFNMVIAIWDDLSPLRRFAFAAWSLLVGTGVCPGLVQAVRYTPKLGLHAWKRFLVAQRGMFAAYRMLLADGRGAGRQRSYAAAAPAPGDARG
jgi:GT2 family glycosyltransferase